MDKKKLFLFKKVCGYLPENNRKCKDLYIKAVNGEIGLDEAINELKKEYGDLTVKLALDLAMDEIKLSMSTFTSLFGRPKTSLKITD